MPKLLISVGSFFTTWMSSTACRKRYSAASMGLDIFIATVTVTDLTHREDNSQDQKLTDEQLAQKLQLHEWNHRDRTMEVNHLPSRGNGSPAVGGSGAIRPK